MTVQTKTIMKCRDCGEFLNYEIIHTEGKHEDGRKFSKTVKKLACPKCGREY